MTATTSLRDTVFSLLAEYGGGAVARVGKVWTTISRVLGNVRQLLRPLLKELVAFLASKLTRGATVARETTQNAGEALLRLVQRLKRKKHEAEQEADPVDEMAAEPEPQKSAPTAKKEATPVRCAATPPSVPAPCAEPDDIARQAILSPREPSDPSQDALSTLGPVVGRALIRALTRPNKPRPLSSNSDLGFAPGVAHH